MGRYIYGRNVEFTYKYWFTIQPSELGKVLSSVLGNNEVKIVENDDGENVTLRNTPENREALRLAILHAEKYTMANWEATRWVLLRILQCAERNRKIKKLRFFSEY
jgi:hypothetical protein